MHHPLPSIMSNSLRGCTSPSLLPCGRRGTACGGGWRARLLIRVPHTLAPILALPCILASILAPLCQLIALRCTVVPTCKTRRLSPTTNVVPPLSGKEGFSSLHHPANQPPPPAITHRWRGPPSFRERGLSFVASHKKESHLFTEAGFLILGFRYLHTVIHCCNCSGNYLVNATATY